VGTPTGTITFLFTDTEGSTLLWQDDEAAMSALMAQHDAPLVAVVGEHNGRVFKHPGDGYSDTGPRPRRGRFRSVAGDRLRRTAQNNPAVCNGP
jgi:class 3 adenylate cyclase